MKFFDYLKNIFIILLIIHFAPMVFESIRKQYSKLLVPSTKVGVLTIKGILYDASYYNNQLTTFFKDNSIKAVLLKIECPGGAAGSSQALFNEIQALKKQYPKPVITLVENVCTSGGYYIACSSDSIIATGAATIGSIGCYLPLFQLKEFIEQFKIGYTPIKTGAYKTITDPLSSKTPEEKALLQELSADIYQQFVEDVAAQRKLSINTVNSWADGKIFTARQAIKLGLIDTIGSAQQAIAVLKEKALIEGEIEWVHPLTKNSLIDVLGGSSDDEGSMFSYCMTQLCSFLEQRYLSNGVVQ